MNKAFLSHSSKQKELVSKVYKSLGKSKCVFDQFDFESGLSILDEIIAGLEKSDLFVVFISDDSLNSEWVQKEILLGQDFLKAGQIKQVLPILIDASIDLITEERIPQWLKNYLLKPISEPYLISKKIKQKLRELLLENNPNFINKESFFVGRTGLIESFESNVFTIKDTKPCSAIISGIPGVGRRTFLTKAFQWINKVKGNYEPILVNLESKDSIEDFIIKLQEFENQNVGTYFDSLVNATLEEKIEEAKVVLAKTQSNNEIVYVIDSGCIIKPSSKIAEWYLRIIKDNLFKESFSLNIVSRFRISKNVIKRHPELFEINIPSLPPNDVEKLFVKYSSFLGLELREEQSKQILELLNGTPSQVHFAVEYISQFGIRETLKNKTEILNFGESQIIYLIDLIKSKSPLSFNILILISKFEFISFDLLFNITGENDEINSILEYFYILGIYDLIGANKEYIKLHHSISDYLNRSKLRIPNEYNVKMKRSIKEFIDDPIISNNHPDVSQLLFNIKGALVADHKIPSRFYIPSFILKTVVELYYLQKYKNVVNLIDNILQNKQRLDHDLVREFRYWLCLTLARQRSKRFDEEVKHIDGTDYHFLIGFANRFLGKYDIAEKALKIAIKKNPGFQRAKRELVSVYLLQDNYNEALSLAKENYLKSPFNAFHIQAYFICLIRKPFLSREDKDRLKNLIMNIEKSYDNKAEEIGNVMKGEYEYYVNKDIKTAVIKLQECYKKNKNTFYPYKALEGVYKKSSMTQPFNDLRDKSKKISKSYD